MKFCEIVEKICLVLESYSRTNPHRIAACKSGEDFEQCVVQATQEALDVLGVSAAVHYIAGSHVFPDIVLEFDDGSKYGVEVKSSTSTSSKSWKINGNSVLGSTKEQVEDTYIIFGKTALGNQTFRYKRYEDSIANVAVTHSPRYSIDLDVLPSDTFFAKSGLSYKEISESEDPIGLITTYFRGQGQRAWWLTESSPAVIRMFSDIPSSEQAMLIGYCFAHFPEIFSSSQKKFVRSAMWLVTDQSVVSTSLRDNFSASGIVNIALPNTTYYELPQVFKRLHKYRSIIIDALDEAPSEQLQEEWAYEQIIETALNEKIKAWIAVVAQQIPAKATNGYDVIKLLSDLLLN